LLIACSALTILVFVSPWVRPNLYHISLLDPRTPVKAMDYIERNHLVGNIMHPQSYGDYLIWRLWPQQHSFFDGRVHLFGEPFVKYYNRIFSDSQWEALLKPYKIRYLLLSKAENEDSSQKLIDAARSSSHWSVQYEDEGCVLFEAVDSIRPSQSAVCVPERSDVGGSISAPTNITGGVDPEPQPSIQNGHRVH